MALKLDTTNNDGASLTTTRRPRANVRPLPEHDRLPNPVLYDHPPKPGHRLAPPRQFRVVSEMGTLDSVHEGRGLTLEDVVRDVTQYFADFAGGEPGMSGDMTVYSEYTVVAIVHRLGDAKGGYRVTRPGETAPPDAAKAARDAAVDDEMIGVENLMDLESEHMERKPVAYSVTEGEFLQYHSHWRQTADQVIAEAAEGWRPGDTHHQAVWHGEELVAVLRPKGDGTAEVIRLDG